jgi:DNA-binding NarL/FixJ family response regulator
MAESVNLPDPIARSLGVGSKRILIVDDNEAVLGVLRTTLGSRGFIICGEALSGTEAIAKAVESRPDLVITDVAMPGGLNGVEVASILQGLLPNVPIILFTFYGDDVGKSFAIIFGIKAIVSKSDGISKLIECVHTVLKQNIHRSASAG